MLTPLRPEELSELIEARFDRSLRALAGSVTDLEFGMSLKTMELPNVWTLNQLRVTTSLSAAELADEAERHQRDLAFRHVNVRHAASGAAAAPALLELGWQAEREVVMALRTFNDRPGDDAGITELAEDQMLKLMATWLREELDEVTDAGLAQVLEYNRREGALWHEGCVGVVDGGVAIAVTKLRVDDGFGWVEDVYALPRARGRGLGRALVTHATRGALDEGCSVVAIVADADDWPQHLYASVGFEAVATAWTFHVASATSSAT